MDRRADNQRLSSLRDIKAFGASFSLTGFGALDLDLDEDDYEAMAAEAEADAQERINKMKGRDEAIDSMLEMEDDEGVSRSETDRSPPRGIGGDGLSHPHRRRAPQEAQIISEDPGGRDAVEGDAFRSSLQVSQRLRDEEKNHSGSVERDSQHSHQPTITFRRRASQEAQIIFEDPRERGDAGEGDTFRSSRQDSQHLTRALSDEEKNHASSVERRDSQHSHHPKRALSDEGKDHSQAYNRKDSNHSEQASFNNSEGGGEKTIKTEHDNAGGILASIPNGVSNAAIHINGANVTINYNIIAQKDDDKALPTRLARDLSEFSSGNDSHVSWSKDGSGSGVHDEPSLGSSERSAGKQMTGNPSSNFGRAREEIVPVLKEEAAIESIKYEDEVPKFVAPAPAPAVPSQRGAAMEGNTQKDTKPKVLNPDCLSKLPNVEAEFNENESQSTFTASYSTNLSKKGGLTASTTSMSASYSTNLSRNIQERGSPVEKSAQKSTKVANAPSQPYDLSKLLDGLWNPADPQPQAESTSKPVSISRKSIGDSSDSSESGVYTAGFTSFYSAGESGGGSGVPHDSNQAMPSLSQIEEMLPAKQISSKSEGGTHAAGRMRPSLKPASSSWGGDGRQVKNKESKRKPVLVQSSKLRPVPQREPVEAKADKPDKTIRSASRSRSRSSSQGETVDDNGQSKTSKMYAGGKGDSEEIMRRLSEFTFEDEEEVEEEVPMGQRVSFSSEPPRKVSMRNLLPSLPSDSERDLSVYEDVSVDKDFDSSPKKQNSGLQMGAIDENDGDCSVTSSVPSYKVDAELSEFAQNFVNQLSAFEARQAQEKQDQRQEDKRRGSNRSAIEEEQIKHAYANRQRDRRASTGKIERKLESTRNVGPDRSNKTKQIYDDTNTQDCPHSHSRGRLSKSMQDRTMTHDPPRRQSHHGGRQSQSGMSKSMRMAKQQSHTSSQMQRSKSARYPSSSNGIVKDQQSPLTPSFKYTIGDSILSSQDMIKDSSVEELFGLDISDYVFVRRSGGRWTFAIVTEISQMYMAFKLDKAGSRKKIARDDLLHNVRQVNYAECSKCHKKQEYH